jgi:hypothetical protein
MHWHRSAHHGKLTPSVTARVRTPIGALCLIRGRACCRAPQALHCTCHARMHAQACQTSAAAQSMTGATHYQAARAAEQHPQHTTAAPSCQQGPLTAGTASQRGTLQPPTVSTAGCARPASQHVVDSAPNPKLQCRQAGRRPLSMRAQQGVVLQAHYFTTARQSACRHMMH